MRFSTLLLSASLSAIAMPAMAQTSGTRTTPVTGVDAITPLAPASGVTPTTTLREALAETYRTNPDLQGQRANQRVTDENVPLARAQGLPGVSTDATYTDSLYDSDRNPLAPARRAAAGIDLSVPVFNGGSVRNSIRAAETRADAGRSSLRATEADVFTQAVTAYVDVLRDESIVRLNQQNVRVLSVNLQATRDRFEVGDLTRTDVAQSEARLALAESQLRSAEARLIGSRENYIRVIGTPPGTLAAPPPLPNLPDDVVVAEDTALANNPTLESVKRSLDATRYDINSAKGGRLPQVSIGLGGDYYNTLGSTAGQVSIGRDGYSSTLAASMRLPLFQGGAGSARVRQAQARRSVALENVTLTERGVIAQARSSFAAYQASLRVIESNRVAVEANRLSLEGVRAENSVGTRTILDILNAEQELLNSQVNYVSAARDAYVSGFNLLAVMGRAEAEDLGLDGGPLYDPMANYERVRGKIWDWSDDKDPTPVGTSTRGTPTQNPNVTAPLDPLFQRPVDIDRANP